MGQWLHSCQFMWISTFTELKRRMNRLKLLISSWSYVTNGVVPWVPWISSSCLSKCSLLREVLKPVASCFSSPLPSFLSLIIGCLFSCELLYWPDYNMTQLFPTAAFGKRLFEDKKTLYQTSLIGQVSLRFCNSKEKIVLILKTFSLNKRERCNTSIRVWNIPTTSPDRLLRELILIFPAVNHFSEFFLCVYALFIIASVTAILLTCL